MEATKAIYEEEFRLINDDVEGKAPLAYEMHIVVEAPEDGIGLRVTPPSCAAGQSAAADSDAGTFKVNFLPPVVLAITYPPTYPSDAPPYFTLLSDWLSERCLLELAERMAEAFAPGCVVAFEWIETVRNEALAAALLDSAGACGRTALSSSTGLPVVLLPWGPDHTADGGSAASRDGAAAASAPDSDSAGGRSESEDATTADTNVVGCDEDLYGYLLRPQPPSARARCLLTADDDPRAILMSFVEHDYARKEHLFSMGEHECGTCWNTLPGAECVLMPRCAHVSCGECFRSFLQIHITNGSLDKIKCMDPKCGQVIDPALVQAHTTDELFERYESLSLTQALARMPDIVYCPRCEGIAALQQESVGGDDDSKQGAGKLGTLGICSACNYSFCSLCTGSWHSGDCVTGTQRAEEIRRTLHLSTKERRELMERKMAELLSFEAATRDSVKCPTCGMGIHKTDGCNKVTCTVCHQHMCYSCGSAIDGYEHFHGDTASCPLFPGQQMVPVMAARRNMRMARAHARRVVMGMDHGPERRCPRCRARSGRMARNNHVVCWACRTAFCFLCSAIISGTKHFIPPSRCQQHGDPAPPPA